MAASAFNEERRIIAHGGEGARARVAIVCFVRAAFSARLGGFPGRSEFFFFFNRFLKQ